jgi:hypothetical protein
LLAATSPGVAGAATAPTAAGGAAPQLITLALGSFNIVLLPPDPCSPSNAAARRCIDVIPGVVQIDVLGGVTPPA